MQKKTSNFVYPWVLVTLMGALCLKITLYDLVSVVISFGCLVLFREDKNVSIPCYYNTL